MLLLMCRLVIVFMLILMLLYLDKGGLLNLRMLVL